MFTVISTSSVSAQSDPALTPQFFRGTVVEIGARGERDLGGYLQVFQKAQVRLQSGETRGEVVEVEQTALGSFARNSAVKKGDQVVVIQTSDPSGRGFVLVDRFRLPQLAVLLGLFFCLAVVLTGWKGVGAVTGLGLSLWFLAAWTVPQLRAGSSPLWISIVTSFGIGSLSLTIAHGWSRRTALALSSTLLSSALSIAVATWAVNFTHLMGAGSEEALSLQFGGTSAFNLHGLLLGGMIIGVLGVLDDITTAQVAAVEEIARANPALSRKQLWNRSLSIGKEHITSLINTIAFAYAGGSLPLLLVFSLSQQPLWVTLNSEFLGEEVVRVLVGSTVLMLAVPITTALACWAFTRPGWQPALLPDEHDTSPRSKKPHRHSR